MAHSYVCIRVADLVKGKGRCEGVVGQQAEDAHLVSLLTILCIQQVVVHLYTQTHQCTQSTRTARPYDSRSLCSGEEVLLIIPANKAEKCIQQCHHTLQYHTLANGHMIPT